MTNQGIIAIMFYNTFLTYQVVLFVFFKKRVLQFYSFQYSVGKNNSIFEETFYPTVTTLNLSISLHALLSRKSACPFRIPVLLKDSKYLGIKKCERIQ